jgi:hypothetical protein
VITALRVLVLEGLAGNSVYRVLTLSFLQARNIDLRNTQKLQDSGQGFRARVERVLGFRRASKEPYLGDSRRLIGAGKKELRSLMYPVLAVAVVVEVVLGTESTTALRQIRLSGS